MLSTTLAFSVHFIPWDEEPCTEIIRDAQADWSDSLECTPFGQRCGLIYNLSSVPEKNSDSRSSYLYLQRGIDFFTAQIMSFKAIFTWPFIVEISTPKPKSPCVQSQVAQF